MSTDSYVAPLEGGYSGSMDMGLGGLGAASFSLGGDNNRFNTLDTHENENTFDSTRASAKFTLRVPNLQEFQGINSRNANRINVQD